MEVDQRQTTSNAVGGRIKLDVLVAGRLDGVGLPGGLLGTVEQVNAERRATGIC